MAPAKLFTGLAFAVVASALAIHLLATVGVESISEPPGSTKVASARANDSGMSCSLEEIRAIASLGKHPGAMIPQLKGYKVSAKLAFGGLLFVDYRCDLSSSSDDFRVSWHSIDEYWEIKKISRLLSK